MKRFCSLRDISSWSILSSFCDPPELTEAFDTDIEGVRSVLISLPELDEDLLDDLKSWYPSLVSEILGFESFEAWKVHARRCSDRLRLLSWRRAYRYSRG